MGRKTWESIPLERRPLKNRLNVVLTNNPDYKLGNNDASIKVFTDFEAALRELSSDESINEIFIIGG